MESAVRVLVKKKSLGKVELEVLRYVDAHQPVTVRQVSEHWEATTGQARTTILTVIDRLKDKGFLGRKKIDGVYHYSTKKSSRVVLQGMVKDFVNSVLGGSLAPFAAYLNDAKNLDPNDVAELKRIVNEMESSQCEKRP